MKLQTFAIAAALTACAGRAPAPAPAPAAAHPVSADPTVLSAEDLRRDAARAPLAAQVADAFPNWNGFFSSLVASWSPDGKQLLFGSTRDGLPEIYVGDPARPSGAARALTTGPERALEASFTADGRYVLFTRDHHGDENHAIWRVAPDGSGATNLTPGEGLHRGPPLLPRQRPGVMLYDAARTSEPSARLYRQEIAGGEPALVYQQPVPGGAADVTPDGARVLFVQWRADAEMKLDEVDVATGRAHRVYPPEGTAKGLYGISYSADGRRALVATDEGDRVVLLALDPETGKELGRYQADDLPYAPIGIRPSPKGDRLAVLHDAGNHGEIRILDARTLKLERKVAVPLAEIQLGVWRADGRAFSILISRPDQPADPYAVDATTGAVAPLRADPRPGLAALPPIDISLQSAKAFDGLTIPINQYLPPRAAGQKLPTIVIFHGGPATSYAVRWSPYARFFVSLGYAVLEPNVRGSSGFGRAYQEADDREKRADWLRDLESVNAWTKSQPWCDPERVIVWGQSYGGYTTLMALTRQPTLWRAGVDLYGPADLKAFLLTTDAAIRAGFVAEFGDVDRDAALLDQFSPMRDVDKIVRPLCVYAGANDPRVPRSQDDTIVKALRARGVPVEYMVAANEGHTVDRRETKIELLTRTARFLEDAAKPR